jgi:CMP/dCMP kinase
MMCHLAINGDIGSGKTSVALLLSQSTGRAMVSAGEILRKMAAEREITALEANHIAERDDAVDTEIDHALVDLARSKNCLIYDSRIAWYLIPGAFKVHLTVDPEVAASRLLAGRSSAVEAYRSIEEAKRSAEERYACERQRFYRRHGVDIALRSNYDLVLDTSDASSAAVAAKVESAWSVRDPSRHPALANPASWAAAGGVPS